MSNNTINSIKEARERAKQKARSLVNKYAEHETAKLSSDWVYGDEYNRINSILAGREVGHEEIGEKYGREGAAGALAAKDKNIKWTDVYTRKNIIARAKQGLAKDVVGGAAAGATSGAALASQVNGDEGINFLIGVGGGALLGAGAGLLKTAGRALIKPGYNYWRGKKEAELKNIKKKYGVD